MSTFGIIREVVYRGTCSSPFSPSIFSLSFRDDPPSLPPPRFVCSIYHHSSRKTGLTFKRSRIKILFALWKFTSFQQDGERYTWKSQSFSRENQIGKLFQTFFLEISSPFLSSGFDSVIIHSWFNFVPFFFFFQLLKKLDKSNFSANKTKI